MYGIIPRIVKADALTNANWLEVGRRDQELLAANNSQTEKLNANLVIVQSDA